MNFYKGDICECTYAGYAGNMLSGVERYKVVKEAVFLLQIEEYKYVRLEDCASGNNVIIMKDYFSSVGDYFVRNLKPLSQEECKEVGLYDGDIYKYSFIGDMFGVESDKIIEENVPLLKTGEHKYVYLKNYIPNKTPIILNDYKTKQGRYFVSNLKPLSQKKYESAEVKVRERKK